jgi:hypothetical protein
VHREKQSWAHGTTVARPKSEFVRSAIIGQIPVDMGETKNLPSVRDYDDWLDLYRSGDNRVGNKITGAKLRRMVILKRRYETDSFISKATNIGCGQTVKLWLGRLPDHLR